MRGGAPTYERIGRGGIARFCTGSGFEIEVGAGRAGGLGRGWVGWVGGCAAGRAGGWLLVGLGGACCV